MRYKTPAALESAVKEAARASSMDTGRAVSGFYFHRLLCRIFSEKDSLFVLKGGQGMLARTVDARATRDIDLLSARSSLDAALEELKRLAAIDLGDFMTFEFDDAEPIKAEDEYRNGLAVTFLPYLGAKRLQRVSIDLVIDEIPAGDAEMVSPADRIEVPGLFMPDYAVYPVTNAIADKLCAICELHDGRPSSRVKDLVDIVLYAKTCEIDETSLAERIRIEASARRITLPSAFSVPAAWLKSHRSTYSRLCAQTSLPTELSDLSGGEALARELLNPVLIGEVGGAWNPQLCCWLVDNE